MIEELRAQFFPQFMAQARARIERAHRTVAHRELVAMVETQRELHALVGEAGLMGLDAVITLARHAERMAQRLVETGSDEAAAALESAVDELGKGLELVSQSTAGEKSP